MTDPLAKLQQNDLDYVATFVLLFPDKVFHITAGECENRLPHQILNCGLLKSLFGYNQPPCSTKNPLESLETADF